jgi:hypothetical protein
VAAVEHGLTFSTNFHQMTKDKLAQGQSLVAENELLAKAIKQIVAYQNVEQVVIDIPERVALLLKPLLEEYILANDKALEEL